MDAIQAAHGALLKHYEKVRPPRFNGRSLGLGEFNSFTNGNQEIDEKVKKEVLMCGHLTKQGKNVLGDWRRRWCILRTDSLHYYKSEAVLVSICSTQTTHSQLK